MIALSLPDDAGLAHEQLAGLERMAEKSAQNLLDAIERSRHRTFDRFINGLGIRHVGESTARALALRFKTISFDERSMIGCLANGTRSAVWSITSKR